MDHFTQILSGLSKEAQLEVLVLFQLDKNSPVNCEAYSSQRKTILIRRLKTFLTLNRPLLRATRGRNGCIF